MKTIKHICLLLALCFSATFMNAQDTVKKKNGEILKVVIKEINDTQVKYHHFDDPNQVMFTLDRAMIDNIEFSYGTKYVEKEPIATDDYFTEDKNMSVKVNITGILHGAAAFTFEKGLSPKSGIEGTLKYYGIGFGPSDDRYDSGFGLEFGYKVKFGALRKKSYEYRPKRLLHGGYIMPFISYDYNKRDNYGYERTQNHVSLGLKFGKQHVIQDLLVIDYYAGFGFFGGSYTEKNKNTGIDIPNDYETVSTADFFGTNNFGITYGFRVGVPFGRYGEKNKKGRR